MKFLVIGLFIFGTFSGFAAFGARRKGEKLVYALMAVGCYVLATVLGNK